MWKTLQTVNSVAKLLKTSMEIMKYRLENVHPNYFCLYASH